MSIDQKTFRNALGCFATGITVITSKSKDNELVGVTINSFASVSLDPPMVLFSLKTESQLTEIFQNTKKFNVNILADDQEAVSNLFAGPNDDKFAEVDWAEGDNGTPVLTKALASLECKLNTAYSGGDHTIFLGDVTKINCTGDDCQGEGSPLLYFRGGYKTF